MFFATISVLCFCPIDHSGVKINQWKIPSVDTKYREEERKPEKTLVLTSRKYFFEASRKCFYWLKEILCSFSRKYLFCLKEILVFCLNGISIPASRKYVFPASGGRTENICVFVSDKDLFALQQGGRRMLGFKHLFRPNVNCQKISCQNK